MTLKLAILTFVLLGTAVPLRAQEPTAPDTFTSDRLEQMAAPIALYPDALVAQILMASTYPLEVVEASRFVQQNPDLQGPALEEALKLQEWDPSVKALCGFPTVLKLMDENLSWTRDLGDAFLAQQPELMDTIQAMRLKAYEAGNLETTEQQQVIREERTIIIQSASPEVIYVPYYEPVYVYGSYWHYPHWYYPGCYIAPRWGQSHYSHFSFSIGFHWGGGLWGGFNWRDHGCHIDSYRYNQFHSRTGHRGSQGNFLTGAKRSEAWQHNPRHRGGVNYRSPKVASQFGAAPGRNRVERDQSHGTKESGFLDGARSRQSRADKQTSTRSSDSTVRTPAPRTDRGRSSAVEQKKVSGPSANRISRDQTRGLAPSTPNRGSGTFRGTRGEAATSQRGGKSFEGGAVGGGARSGPSKDSGARSSGSSSQGGRAIGSVSGSGRSSKSFGGGAAASGTRSGGSPGNARGGSVGSGGRSGKSSGGAVNSGARSGKSSGVGRGGAISSNGRKSESVGGGSRASGGSRDGGKRE